MTASAPADSATQFQREAEQSRTGGDE